MVQVYQLCEYATFYKIGLGDPQLIYWIQIFFVSFEDTPNL